MSLPDENDISYTGRASVPTPGLDDEPPAEAPPVAVVGRAVVRPVEPSMPSYSVGAGAPATDKGAAKKPATKKETRRKKDRRKRLLIAGLALVILLSGVGMMAGTYFFNTVPLPSELTLENNTEVYASDGTTQLAKLGSKNRSEIGMDKLAKPIRDALIAGEDKKFYDHHGIDLWGIGRAAWNNLTGGETQGASTITQQYARQAAQDLEVSYARKLREAVMARKLEDEYSKEEILGFYLNTVYFGRGAYGIGAAAEAYFGIPADKIETMTVAQAAVLGAVLRQPEPEGSTKGYDPQNDPAAAKDRWNYVLNNMVEMNWLPAAERATLKYPDPADPKAPKQGELQIFDAAKSAGAWGYTDRGTGYVVNYVANELAERGVVKYLNDNLLGNWKNAGLRITTTINPAVQGAMEAQLNRDLSGSSMSSQAPNIVGAGVAIDPTNGRVLAYYGGTNSGSNVDWAGQQAPHPPASSFKIYTLAAAIKDGISTQSHWDSREMKKGVNGADVDLANAGRGEDPGCVAYCTLEMMAVQSYNVPFYQVTKEVGPQKVIQMAANAGVRTVWSDSPEKPYDLTKGAPAGRSPFDYYAGIGQYPITVLDHATGTATIANHGVYNKAHFVIKVERKNRKTGKWEHLSIGDEKLDSKRTIDAVVADEVTGVLKQIPKGDAASGSGRESAGKTGTWENGLIKGTNAHAWYTGFTNQVVATFWIGSLDVNKTPLKTPGGANIGSAYPKGLWKKFIDKVDTDLKLPAQKLAAGTGGKLGNADRGTGQSPSAAPTADPQPTSTPTPKPTPKPTGLPTILPTPTGTKKPD